MRDFGLKKDNTDPPSGVVVADDYNSVFQELDNAVKPFISLKDGIYDQLVKSVDIAVKHPTYEYVTNDGNDIVLKRAGLNAFDKETLTDGMYIIFLCKVRNNRPSMTAKIGNLPAKPVKVKNVDPVGGYMITGAYFSLTYIASRGVFELDSVSGDNLYYRKSYIDGSFYNRPHIDGLFNGVLRDSGFNRNTAGHQVFSNGLIIQWNRFNRIEKTLKDTLFYPAFPNAVLSLQLSYNLGHEPTNDTLPARLLSFNVTKSNYSIFSGFRDPQEVFMMAVGY